MYNKTTEDFTVTVEPVFLKGGHGRMRICICPPIGFVLKITDPKASICVAAIGILYRKKLHTVYPMLYKPTLKNSKN